MVKGCIDLFETRNDLGNFDKPQGCTLTPALEHNEHKNKKTAVLGGISYYPMEVCESWRGA